jgi:hypothetical protein
MSRRSGVLNENVLRLEDTDHDDARAYPMGLRGEGPLPKFSGDVACVLIVLISGLKRL